MPNRSFRHAISLVAIVLRAIPACAQAEPPQTPIAWVGGAGIAQFHTANDQAELDLRAPNGNITPLRMINIPDDALAVLADERLAPVWPALLAWAGNDLQLLRDRSIARALRAANGQISPILAESAGEKASHSKNFAAFLQYVKIVAGSGQSARAIAFIRAQIANPTFGRSIAYDDSALYIALADIIFAKGNPDEAIATLTKAESDPRLSTPFKLNVDINLAAMLAKTGEYASALQIIDAARTIFAAESSGFFTGHQKITGSDDYFAAIRACALAGLGRKSEGLEALSAIIDQSHSTVALPTAVQARLLAYSCMHDPAGLASELALQLQDAPPAGDIFLQFQVDRESVAAERATLAMALEDRRVVRAMAGRVRKLGPDFAPALTGWKNPGVAIAH